MAAQIGMSQKEEKILLRAALLHDVGIATTERVKNFSVLSKYKNKKIMEKHVENGYDLLKNS